MLPVTRQENVLFGWMVKGFFFIVKTLTVCLLILAGVLVVSQSAVAPVSARLLGMYAVEYTNKAVKPYRHFFPKPYMVNLEEQEETYVRH